MTRRITLRPAYDNIRPVMPVRIGNQRRLPRRFNETTPSAAQTAEKPHPWPVVLLLISALLAMGFFWCVSP